MKPYGLALATLALLAGCAPKAPAKAEAPQAVQSVALVELMGHVIQPAADGVWSRQGYEVTVDGEHDTFPTTDEGWLEAENASATVAEVAKLLLTLERRLEGDQWLASAQALNKAGHEAFEAAEARDKQAFFEAGGRIYEACTSCHEQYIKLPAEGASAPAKP